jgi:hypothetical protein
MKSFRVLLGCACLASCLSVEPDDLSLGEHEQAEIIEVHGCRPGWLQHGDVCVDPTEGGGDGGGGGPTGAEGGPGGPGGPGPGGGPGGGTGCPTGGGGCGRTMDPEPDHNKDRKSCFDWCDWNKRQCIKECRSQFPDPYWYKRNKCIRDRCDNHEDPNIGHKECRLDCQRRFPERPAVAPEAPQ